MQIDRYVKLRKYSYRRAPKNKDNGKKNKESGYDGPGLSS